MNNAIAFPKVLAQSLRSMPDYVISICMYVYIVHVHNLRPRDTQKKTQCKSQGSHLRRKMICLGWDSNPQSLLCSRQSSCQLSYQGSFSWLSSNHPCKYKAKQGQSSQPDKQGVVLIYMYIMQLHVLVGTFQSLTSSNLTLRC